MTYDHELILISQPYIFDEIGNQISDPDNVTETSILCAVKSVNREEFYRAAVAGLNPEIVFLIHAYEYNGERKVKFNDETYRVIRTYQTDFEEMELVCERVAADG